jgi:hypothetical protein
MTARGSDVKHLAGHCDPRTSVSKGSPRHKLFRAKWRLASLRSSDVRDSVPSRALASIGLEPRRFDSDLGGPLSTRPVDFLSDRNHGTRENTGEKPIISTDVTSGTGPPALRCWWSACSEPAPRLRRQDVRRPLTPFQSGCLSNHQRSDPCPAVSDSRCGQRSTSWNHG